MKTVLITGANGQLASELRDTAPGDVNIISCGRGQLDIADADAVNVFFGEHEIDAIINTAAYTAVDQAEHDAEQARRVNVLGVEHLAKACTASCYFLHISTDFVFDGSGNRPYKPNHPAKPLGVYGETKYQGEQHLQAIKPDNSAIIRTSWVYSVYGSNFVKSMLRLMAERDSLNIVVDQVGTPTWARGLAEVCWQALSRHIEGVFHWSDAGAISWFDFAAAIQNLALEQGLLDQAIPLHAIPTEAYPTPARRPAYSVLDKRDLLQALPDLENNHWQVHLKQMLAQLNNA